MRMRMRITTLPRLALVMSPSWLSRPTHPLVLSRASISRTDLAAAGAVAAPRAKCQWKLTWLPRGRTGARRSWCATSRTSTRRRWARLRGAAWCVCLSLTLLSVAASQMLLDEINETHRGKYDFFYLPIDFKNRCNVGYAFMNFIDFKDIISFYHTYNAKKWRLFNSEKVRGLALRQSRLRVAFDPRLPAQICQLSYGRIQGKDSLVTRFQNSSLMDKEAGCRPLLFQSSGPRKGEPEEFPVRAARHSGRSHNRGHHHHRR